MRKGEGAAEGVVKSRLPYIYLYLFRVARPIASNAHVHVMAPTCLVKEPLICWENLSFETCPHLGTATNPSYKVERVDDALHGVVIEEHAECREDDCVIEPATRKK